MPNREPTKEEFDAISNDLNDVLLKHNAEIGVKSSIEILIRMPVKAEPVKSPFVIKEDGKPGDKTEEGPKA
jgi:hypothetical protein